MLPNFSIIANAIAQCTLRITYLADVTAPCSLLLQGGCHQDDRHRRSAAALGIQDDPEIQSIVVDLVLFLAEGCAEQVG